MSTAKSSGRPRVFIGSSGKAKKADLLNSVSTRLNDIATAIPWDDHSTPGESYLLKSLLSSANTYDFGVFIYSKDEEVTDPGGANQSLMTRQSVVLETGMFLHSCGDQRVYLLVEEGVELPTDLKGFLNQKFKKEDLLKHTADHPACIEWIRKGIKELGRRNFKPLFREPSDFFDEFGLREVISRANSMARDLAVHVEEYSNSQKRIKGPLRFYSNILSKTAYSGGLRSVKKSYVTTTTLDSAFWDRINEVEVIAANKEMITRLKRDGGSGRIRRLFLTREPLDVVLGLIQDNIIACRRRQMGDLIRETQEKYEKLLKIVEEQQANGVSVRIVNAQLSKSDLPEEMSADSRTEIAIFDDNRVDLYRTSSSGDLVEVQVFTNISESFPVYLEGTSSLFERLWADGKPAAEVLKEIIAAIRHAIGRIDYRVFWLSHYEMDYNPDDAKIKTTELERVKEYLRRENAKIRSYLDIGTCTARYPLALSDFLDRECKVIAIDDDEDCIDFTQDKLRTMRADPALTPEQKEGIRRIEISRGDFLAERLPNCLQGKTFQLITCMLGTVSHFGQPRSQHQRPEDLVAEALQRMFECCEVGGHVFIGNWSEAAIRSRRLLAIYSEEDRAKLCGWTLRSVTLEELATRVGFEVVDKAPTGEIDLFYLRRPEGVAS